MTDSEKLSLIMKYFHMNDYYRSNELRVALQNLNLHKKGDVIAVLEYYKQCCFKQMWDKVFDDVARIIYNH